MRQVSQPRRCAAVTSAEIRSTGGAALATMYRTLLTTRAPRRRPPATSGSTRRERIVMSARPEPTRMARPDDYDAIAAVVNDWWGRPVLPALPRLFLNHFYRTSLVVDGPDGPLAFLVGILSPSEPDHAYIHFVGVSPAAR